MSQLFFEETDLNQVITNSSFIVIAQYNPKKTYQGRWSAKPWIFDLKEVLLKNDPNKEIQKELYVWNTSQEYGAIVVQIAEQNNVRVSPIVRTYKEKSPSFSPSKPVILFLRDSTAIRENIPTVSTFYLTAQNAYEPEGKKEKIEEKISDEMKKNPIELALQGKVVNLEPVIHDPIPMWQVDLSVQKVIQGTFPHTTYSFLIHSPAQWEIEKGKKYKIKVIWTGKDYQIESCEKIRRTNSLI